MNFLFKEQRCPFSWILLLLLHVSLNDMVYPISTLSVPAPLLYLTLTDELQLDGNSFIGDLDQAFCSELGNSSPFSIVIDCCHQSTSSLTCTCCGCSSATTAAAGGGGGEGGEGIGGCR